MLVKYASQSGVLLQSVFTCGHSMVLRESSDIVVQN